ncbi:hypothetical protein ACFY6U_50900 [Streptomyces sp. NPDC013157]|uniref:hypothetical protein n=1 Tax=Streptomyces sp. NPDC013157 TaxID=3364861 RepID=UPI00369FBA79
MPTFSQIDIAAPIPPALLCLVQGFTAGGEKSRRIPFLLSVPLTFFGPWVRRALPETAGFLAAPGQDTDRALRCRKSFGWPFPVSVLQARRAVAGPGPAQAGK